MTTLNVTMTPSRAWISQDRAFYDHGELPGLDVLAKDHAHHSTLAGMGTKIIVRPDMAFIAGTAGGYPYWLAWSRVLENFLGDFDALSARAAVTLRDIFAKQPADQRELIVVLAGWSEREGRVVGYGYQHEKDFEPMRLHDGLTQTGPLDPNAPGYDRLEQLWHMANRGEHVPEFHRAVFANQKWQCDNGLMRAGVLLSDDFDLASVDESGARLSSGSKTVVA